MLCFEDHIVNNVNYAALGRSLSGIKGRETLCVVFCYIEGPSLSIILFREFVVYHNIGLGLCYMSISH